MSVDEGRSRRETFRQDEVLAIKEKFLTSEQFSAEMNRTGIVSQHTGLMKGLINSDACSDLYNTTLLGPELTTALEALDLKLNYLITLNMEKDNDVEYSQRLVNLSATGIGFVTQEQCNKGDRLIIKINLPLFPPVNLELLGEVVSVSSDGNKQKGLRIGVSFFYRCEQEEEAIVKYLFKRQREMIRTKYQQRIRHTGINDL